MKSQSWDLGWLAGVQQLRNVDMNGSSLRTLQLRGLRISALCPLHTVRIKLTEDAPTDHKEYFTSLRDVSVAFGHGNRAPLPDTLATLLCSWTDLTRLHFTFAQAFVASQRLMEAIAGLTALQDLQINSFDITQMIADDLAVLSQLTRLERLELSGMNQIGGRCDAIVFMIKSWPVPFVFLLVVWCGFILLRQAFAMRHRS